MLVFLSFGISRKYKFGYNDKIYFISFVVVCRIDVFIRKEYKDILIDSGKFFAKEKWLLKSKGCAISPPWSCMYVVATPSGQFITGAKLSPDQINDVLTKRFLW